jgi:hypothetical protein
MTVVARRIKAAPVRVASETWTTIVNLLAPDANDKAREELLAVTGVASSLIADEVMQDAPIVVYGSGPRVRIYCLYGEDAVSGENANEVPLVSSPLKGDWSMSLPCQESDLKWAQNALKKVSTHITARDMTTAVEDASDKSTSEQSIRINKEAFFRS